MEDPVLAQGLPIYPVHDVENSLGSGVLVVPEINEALGRLVASEEGFFFKIEFLFLLLRLVLLFGSFIGEFSLKLLRYIRWMKISLKEN